jgi:hypothetical protein
MLKLLSKMTLYLLVFCYRCRKEFYCNHLQGSWSYTVLQMLTVFESYFAYSAFPYIELLCRSSDWPWTEALAAFPDPYVTILHSVLPHWKAFITNTIIWKAAVKSMLLSLLYYYLCCNFLMWRSISDRWMNEYGVVMEWYWEWTTKLLWTIFASLPLCPPQTARRLT